MEIYTLQGFLMVFDVWIKA